MPWHNHADTTYRPLYILERGRAMKAITCSFVLHGKFPFFAIHIHVYATNGFFTFSTVCSKRISILCLFVCLFVHFLRNRFLHTHPSHQIKLYFFAFFLIRLAVVACWRIIVRIDNRFIDCSNIFHT